jgi:endonuclease III
LRWYAAQHRDLPWRRTRDPYRIWVSEIMLQQTRAEAVIPYYERFLERFPSIAALAAASAEEILASWSGLGYYSRARNLHKAARQMGGLFPSGYQAIRELPGVGDYTAAAISSIAFGLPYAVLDGNVLRVVARLTNDSADISAGRTRARFREIAQQWLDRRQPGAFNQAMMELGATVCLPRVPRCEYLPTGGGMRSPPRRPPTASAGEAAEDAAGEDRDGGRHCGTAGTAAAVAKDRGFASVGRLLGVAFTRAIAGVARDGGDRHVSPHDYASSLSGECADGSACEEGSRRTAPALDSC